MPLTLPSTRNLMLFVLVSIAWYFGATSLWEILTNFSTMWYWYVIATFYCVILNDIFVHIICSHRAIEVDPSRWLYKILAFLSIVDHSFAPITGYCKFHENHHLYADQGNHDNLNWRIHWYNLCIMSPITFLYTKRTDYPDWENYIAKQKQDHAVILDDLWTFFVEENRVLLTILYWLVLYMVFPAFLFYVVFTGRFLFSIFVLISAIGGHTKLPLGYRNFDTPDTSHNNFIFHYVFCLGLMPSQLQNNHHGSTKSTARWFEVDIGGWVLRLMQPWLTKKQH